MSIAIEYARCLANSAFRPMYISSTVAEKCPNQTSKCAASIGDRAFTSAADADARPEYVFSGDGFHPGTAAQAKIAQMIVEAFQAKYPKTAITPLSDAEILIQVLGL